MYAPGKAEEVFTNNNGNILPYNEFRINEIDRKSFPQPWFSGIMRTILRLFS